MPRAKHNPFLCDLLPETSAISTWQQARLNWHKSLLGYSIEGYPPMVKSNKDLKKLFDAMQKALKQQETELALTQSQKNAESYLNIAAEIVISLDNKTFYIIKQYSVKTYHTHIESSNS